VLGRGNRDSDAPEIYPKYIIVSPVVRAVAVLASLLISWVYNPWSPY
jgi:hypothetical protein